MLAGNLNALHQDLVGLGVDAEDLALLALVAAGDDNDHIVFTNLHNS